jgi:hypothetical protein
MRWEDEERSENVEDRRRTPPFSWVVGHMERFHEFSSDFDVTRPAGGEHIVVVEDKDFPVRVVLEQAVDRPMVEGPCLGRIWRADEVRGGRDHEELIPLGFEITEYSPVNSLGVGDRVIFRARPFTSERVGIDGRYGGSAGLPPSFELRKRDLNRMILFGPPGRRPGMIGSQP